MNEDSLHRMIQREDYRRRQTALPRFGLLPVLALALVSPTDQWSRGLQSSLDQSIPGLLQQALVPGISIAVVENGKVSWHGCYGVKNSETREPVRDDTVFEAASLSKPVFAYAVMKLVDDGKLDLDKPVIELVPEADLHRAYPPTKNGDPRYKRITPRMILTHSTGFPNWFRNRPMSFLFDPGARFSYSGEAFTLLAVTVEAITGKGFNDFMTDAVFEPLGMKDSSYIWRDAYERQFASSHDMVGRPSPRGKALTPRAGASLYTTAVDYARFLAALSRGEGLSRKSWEEMLRPQIGVRRRDNQGDVLFHWGLGIGSNQTEKGKTIWHWGDNGDFNAYFEVLQGGGRGVVFFMNGANAHALTQVIVRQVLGIKNPAITAPYFDYPALDSPAMELTRAYASEGMEGVAAKAPDLLPDRAAWESEGGRRVLALARIGFRQGRFAAVQKTLDSFLAHVPDDEQALILWAGIRLVQGDRAGMESRLNKAAAEGAELENSINSLGYELLRAGHADEAIAAFEFNARRYPKSANCFDSLAEAWLGKGDRDKAVLYYRKALEIDPDLSSAREALQRLGVARQPDAGPPP